MPNFFDKLRKRFSGLYQKSREEKFLRFQSLTNLQPGDTILDVGVDVLEVNPFENLLEKRLSDTYQIVAVTLGNPASIKDLYPKVRFVRADGCHLPFRDDSFETLFSNAVIEHVGDESQQHKFVSEMVRVGKRGVLTTPYFWFPVEVHTSMPLVHYLPWFIRRYIFRFIAGRDNEEYMSVIRLLSVRSFRRLFDRSTMVKVFRMRATIWPETLLAYFQK